MNPIYNCSTRRSRERGPDAFGGGVDGEPSGSGGSGVV